MLAGRVDLFYDNTATTRPYVESGQGQSARGIEPRARAHDAAVPTLIETGVVDLEMESLVLL